MGMQLTADFLVGGSIPSRANDQGFEPLTQNFAAHCITIQTAFDVTAMCLPTAWSLLSENFSPPPHPHPPQKSDFQF